jgi:hypothetical protein
MFQPKIRWTDFDEVSYDRYAIKDYAKEKI